MQFDVQDLGVSRKRVQFEIPAEVVRGEIEKAYSHLGSTIRMKGFRPGKVPRKLLEQRFGRKIEADVASVLIQRSWGEVGPNLRLAGPPAVEKSAVSGLEPFRFSITVDVRPEVQVKDYKGAEVAWVEPTVDDAQLEQVVTRRLQRAERIVEVTEDRPVAEKDIVVTEVILKDGDDTVVHEAGTAIRIGEEKYYPGVDALLIGLRRGEEKVESITIGKDAQVPGLAGRVVEAHVKPLTIQAMKAPELTDEVAGELGFEGGVEGMRSALREQIRSRMAETTRNEARSRLLWKIVEAHAFDVPKGLVDERYDLMVEEAKALHIWQGRDPNTFALAPKAVEEYRRNAVMNVRASLVLEGIARQEGIEVTEADLDAAYQKIADERGQAVEAIKGYFVAEDAVGLLRDRLLEQKTLDWLFENATLVAPPAGEAAEAEAAPAEAPVEENPVAESPVEAAPAETEGEPQAG